MRRDDVLSFAILVFGAVFVALTVADFYTMRSVLAWNEECSFDCTSTAFQLHINGYQVEGLGDMTEAECLDALLEFDASTPAFAKIQCVEVEIKREES
jgi:hypothetical protein